MESKKNIDLLITTFGYRFYFLIIVLIPFRKFSKDYNGKLFVTLDFDLKINWFKKLIIYIIKFLFKVEFIFGENLGPHTKYYHYLKTSKGLNSFVIVDDDSIYSYSKIKFLIKEGIKNDGCSYNRSLRAQFVEGIPNNYNKWLPIGKYESSKFVFGTNVGGVYVSERFRRVLLENINGFKGSCDKADDVWFYYLAIKYNLLPTNLGRFYNPRTIPFTQFNALFYLNRESGNDIQLKNVFKNI